MLGLTLDIELFSQAHYRSSIDPDPGLSELWKDVFLFHWKEESQHAILDELEWRREHARCSAAEREQGVSDLIDLVGASTASSGAGRGRRRLLHRQRRTRLVGRRAGIRPRRRAERTFGSTSRPARRAALRGGADGADDAGADGPDRCCAGAIMAHAAAGMSMHVASSTDERRETVVLLHSSAASARQWDALAAALAGRYRVHALDLHGHGAGPAWHGESPFTLADDAALVAPLLADAGSAHLVGHSYGGAIALKVATLQPGRVKSVVAYEPVLFRTLVEEDAWGLPARDVRALADVIRDCLRAGKPVEAARQFVEFWSGRGGFDRMAAARQGAIAERMPTVLLHFEALFADAPSTGELQRLAMPRLFLTGSRTVATTRRLGELLRQNVPSAAHEKLPGLGHLGPITEAAAFNRRVAAFLAEPVMPLDCAMSRAMAGAWSRIAGAASAPRNPAGGNRRMVTLSALVRRRPRRGRRCARRRPRCSACRRARRRCAWRRTRRAACARRRPRPAR